MVFFFSFSLFLLKAAFHPAPAGAVVSYQDVLDFDEKTLQRVLSAGSFSTSGSADELRQRALRLLQLQADGATEGAQLGPTDEGISSSEQIRKVAKPLEISKDAPDPGKVREKKTKPRQEYQCWWCSLPLSCAAIRFESIRHL